MDYPIRRRARRLPFGSDTKQMVAEAVGRLRVKQGLRYELVLENRVREFGERVDLFPGGLLIEEDGSVAGVADGGHRQVLLVARRAVLFADVPAERLARSGRARLQCRQRLLGPSDYTRIIEVIGKSALWRGDFFGERRLFSASSHKSVDNRRLAALFGDQPRGLRHESERPDRFAARRVRSEERRVGKEGRCAWSPNHEENNCNIA